MKLIHMTSTGLLASALVFGLAGCEETGTGGAAGAGDNVPAGGGGKISVAHSGDAIAHGATYNIPDNNPNPASSAVAVFSVQRDLVTVTNRDSAAITVDSVKIETPKGVMTEEFRACHTDSDSYGCDAVPVGALEPEAGLDFYLHFYPVASGNRTATLVIDFTDANGAQRYSATISAHGRIGSDENPANLLTSGTLERHKVWGGFGSNQTENPGPMVADASGNIYFAGTGKAIVGASSSDKNIFVVKLNADGSLAWQKVYHSSNHDELAQAGDNLGVGVADAMAIDADGFVYLTGKAGNGNNKTYGLVMKIDPSNGNAVWTKYWFGDTDRLQYTDSADTYAIDVSGSMLFLTGKAKSDVSTQGIPVIAISTDGAHLWSKIIVPQGAIGSAHRGHTIKADGNGNVYVGGIDYSPSPGPFLAKLSGVDASGAGVALAWAKTFGGETRGSNVNSMDIDAAGNVYLSMDRRGATTYFSVAKVTPDGTSATGTTLPGTGGDRNNIHVVRVVGDSVFAGGRIGLSGWDTTQGDGMLASLSTDDLSIRWGAVYYTGTGSDEICHHSVHGIAANGSDVHVVGQVYTGNANFNRYWGYWYDYPMSAESYRPSASDTTGSTILSDMPRADFVAGNGSSFDVIEGSANVEYQDADAKNATTNGAAVDADVFIVKLKM